MERQATCQSSFAGTRCAGALLEDNLCLAHSNNAAKDPRAFGEIIDRKLAAANFDFVGYSFPENTAAFAGKTFSNIVDFRSATFDGALDCRSSTFNGNVDFRSTTFNRATDFESSAFSGTASFRHARFRRFANFRLTTFSREAEFHNAHFSRAANFMGVTFSGVGTFVGATFADDAYFEGSTFSRTANFMGATFAVVHFSQTDFSAGAHFSDATFQQSAAFHRTEFGGALILTGVNLENARFQHVNLRQCLFSGSRNLDKADFEDVTGWAQWPEKHSRWRPGRLAVADELHARKGYVSYNFPAAERVYRGLRQSYEEHNDKPRANEFYFAEMEMRRLSVGSVPTGRFQHLLHWLQQTFGSLTALYGLISGYGQRWIRPLLWLLALVIVWALLYVSVGLWIKAPDTVPAGKLLSGDLLERYSQALLHSFLVATLVGRDAYAVPINAQGQTLQAAELVLGPLLLGLMGLAVRRRFER